MRVSDMLPASYSQRQRLVQLASVEASARRGPSLLASAFTAWDVHVGLTPSSLPTNSEADGFSAVEHVL